MHHSITIRRICGCGGPYCTWRRKWSGNTDLPDTENWAGGFYYNLQTGSTMQYANQGFFHITVLRLQGNGAAPQLLGSNCFKKLHHQPLTSRSTGGNSVQKNPEVSDVWLMFNDPVKSEKWAAGN